MGRTKEKERRNQLQQQQAQVEGNKKPPVLSTANKIAEAKESLLRAAVLGIGPFCQTAHQDLDGFDACGPTMPYGPSTVPWLTRRVTVLSKKPYDAYLHWPWPVWAIVLLFLFIVTASLDSSSALRMWICSIVGWKLLRLAVRYIDSAKRMGAVRYKLHKHLPRDARLCENLRRALMFMHGIGTLDPDDGMPPEHGSGAKHPLAVSFQVPMPTDRDMQRMYKAFMNNNGLTIRSKSLLFGEEAWESRFMRCMVQCSSSTNNRAPLAGFAVRTCNEGQRLRIDAWPAPSENTSGASYAMAGNRAMRLAEDEVESAAAPPCICPSCLRAPHKLEPVSRLIVRGRSRTEHIVITECTDEKTQLKWRRRWRGPFNSREACGLCLCFDPRELKNVVEPPIDRISLEKRAASCTRAREQTQENINGPNDSIDVYSTSS